MSLRFAASLPLLLRAALLPLLLLEACSGGNDSSAYSSSASPDREIHRDSGGSLSPEQAAYDVQLDDLILQIFPAEQRIAGILTMEAKVLAPLPILVLDLDPLLKVESVTDRSGTALGFRRRAGQLRIALLHPARAGDSLRVSVRYGGKPRIAPNPPWEGGFQWSTTPDGRPWIATSCQMEGADLWWPCKDHPSDKAEKFKLHIRVPDGLVVATNGRLMGRERHADGTHTAHWQVDTPIANYAVAVDIAPYELIENRWTSVAGDEVPLLFFALPSHADQARAFMSQVLDQLHWFEKDFGPYPFRIDKCGIAETPHLGMENQSITAYGNDFRPGPRGFDELLHHELAHEWFANLITAPDWNDFWLHEGFATYAQALYAEDLGGNRPYHEFMAEQRQRILNRKPMAPDEPRSTMQMYFTDPDAVAGSKPPDSDIYCKGAWVLHSLRHLIGREPLVASMRRLAYPDPALEFSTDGRACHFATSRDYQRIVEQLTGRDLAWFFDLYLRQPELPRLESQRAGGRVILDWKTPGDRPFPMPVTVRAAGNTWRVEMPGGHGELRLPEGMKFLADPDDQILREHNYER